MNRPPSLIPNEVAAREGVTHEAVRLWCETVPGLARKVGNRWHINADALDAFLARRRAQRARTSAEAA